MEILIREARQADIPQLKALEQGLIRAERPFDPTIRQDPVSYYDLQELLDSSESLVLVAEGDGQLLSCGYARRRIPRHYLDHEAYAYLGFMYTVPEYRGQGLNGRIVGGLRQWCRDQGLAELRLTVYTGNQPAIRAYEKAGFKGHLLEMRLRDQ